ncbi:MAG: hypothetical protein P4M14_05040 [Gammaproteobacteria bacterium]|nr:hypothetical protein [Gammaproteobacteria bacterium]
MENIQINQEVKGKLSLDTLLAALANAKAETTRLTRYSVDEIFHLIMSEIPYAFQIIPRLLAEILLDDSPQKSKNLSLNEVVICLGHAVFNPAQKEELSQLVKTYLIDRKKTEKEYATTILNNILNENTLTPFPESVQASLRELAQTIIESVINEKQLRKVPGYIPRPLTDITRPIVYSKLYNLELDRLKFSHRAAFRKFVSSISYDSYDKIQDTDLLIAILQEKENAYNHFKDAIARKAPNEENLIKFQNLLKFEQFDRNRKFATLKKMLDEFLKVDNVKNPLGYLSHHLRLRFSEKLQKLLFSTDINADTYLSEATIKEMHDKEFHEVEYDVNAVKTLMAEVLNIQTNFKKNFFHVLTGSKYFAMIEGALVNALLGSSAIKTDPLTGKKSGVRDGGYLKASLPTIYAQAAGRLKVIADSVTGLFAEKLKGEIRTGILNIRHAQEKLIGYSADAMYVPMEEPEETTASEEIVPAVTPPAETTAKVISPPLQVEETQEAKTSVTTEEPTTKVVPKPLVIEEDLDAASVPVTEEPTAKIVPKPLLIDEDFAAEPTVTEEPTAKVEPKPLFIAEDFDSETPPLTAEPVEKVIPKPLLIDEDFGSEVAPAEAEKVIPKPLLIDEDFAALPTEEPTEKVIPKPLLIDEDFTTEPTTSPEEPTEKVVPKPLLIEDDFDAIPTDIAEEPAEKVVPKLLLIDEVFSDEPAPTVEEPAAKLVPKPLQIDETFDAELPAATEEPVEKIVPKPLLIEADFTEEPAPETEPTEKVVPKPLLIDEDFDVDPATFTLEPAEKVVPKPLIIEDVEFEPEIATEAVSGSVNESSMGAGEAIMKNYQLGELKSSVVIAWEKMVKSTTVIDEAVGTLTLLSDNEVRLYVICDLIQQVVAIDESSLSSSKKQILQNTKHKLMDALEDPLNENNWGFFEGVRRDNIDRNLESLRE